MDGIRLWSPQPMRPDVRRARVWKSLLVFGLALGLTSAVLYAAISPRPETLIQRDAQ